MIKSCLNYFFFVSYYHYYMFLFFFNDMPPTEIFTLSLHDALPIWGGHEHFQGAGAALLGEQAHGQQRRDDPEDQPEADVRSEEHTSELQSLRHLVCRLLLEKKKN